MSAQDQVDVSSGKDIVIILVCSHTPIVDHGIEIVNTASHRTVGKDGSTITVDLAGERDVIKTDITGLGDLDILVAAVESCDRSVFTAGSVGNKSCAFNFSASVGRAVEHPVSVSSSLEDGVFTDRDDVVDRERSGIGIVGGRIACFSSGGEGQLPIGSAEDHPASAGSGVFHQTAGHIGNTITGNGLVKGDISAAVDSGVDSNCGIESCYLTINAQSGVSTAESFIIESTAVKNRSGVFNRSRTFRIIVEGPVSGTGKFRKFIDRDQIIDRDISICGVDIGIVCISTAGETHFFVDTAVNVVIGGTVFVISSGEAAEVDGSLSGSFTVEGDGDLIVVCAFSLEYGIFCDNGGIYNRYTAADLIGVFRFGIGTGGKLDIGISSFEDRAGGRQCIFVPVVDRSTTKFSFTAAGDAVFDLNDTAAGEFAAHSKSVGRCGVFYNISIQELFGSSFTTFSKLPLTLGILSEFIAAAVGGNKSIAAGGKEYASVIAVAGGIYFNIGVGTAEDISGETLTVGNFSGIADIRIAGSGTVESPVSGTGHDRLSLIISLNRLNFEGCLVFDRDVKINGMGAFDGKFIIGTAQHIGGTFKNHLSAGHIGTGVFSGFDRSGETDISAAGKCTVERESSDICHLVGKIAILGRGVDGQIIVTAAKHFSGETGIVDNFSGIADQTGRGISLGTFESPFSVALNQSIIAMEIGFIFDSNIFVDREISFKIEIAVCSFEHVDRRSGIDVISRGILCKINFTVTVIGTAETDLTF